MYTLEERIRTRFVQGMIADVQPPEYELRLAILRKKSEKNKINKTFRYTAPEEQFRHENFLPAIVPK